MKRTPLGRKTPLTSDPQKSRDWQRRSVGFESGRQGRERGTRSTARRRNDAPWRKEVEAKRGRYCRACLTSHRLQADHIKPRSQGGPSVVENGMLLCEEHHTAKTNGELRIQRDWLDEDQIVWLREQGWVWWDDDDGEVYGRGRNHFEPHKAA